MENDFSASSEPLIAQLAEQRTVVGFCCYPRVAGSIPAQRSSYLNDLYMIQIRIQSHVMQNSMCTLHPSVDFLHSRRSDRCRPGP